MNIVRRRLDDLQLDPANARTHDKRNLGAIRSSIERFGQVEPIVVQRSSGRVIGGNGRVEVLREMGETEVDVVEVDVDDINATALGIALNRTAELAEWDEDTLGRLLGELDQAGLTEVVGFSDREVEQMLGSVDQVVEDEIPDLPAEPISRPGDLWLLGDHRLLVGDATDGESVERLMDGGLAACVWTDPPFGVRYVGRTADALTIRNDTVEGLAGLLIESFTVADGVLEPGAPFYIVHPAGPLSLAFHQAVVDVGWRHHQTLMWKKDTLVLGHSDHHYIHEPILYGWTEGPGRSGRGRHEGSRWYGDDAQTSVIEVPRPKRSADHPTSKPVELVARCLRNSTRRDGVVYEPFCGSGSTLIACEQTGRVCRALEIDPRYADVVVRRWESLTGGVATREQA